ncbi:MAG: thiamine phosphate synthase [Parvularculaceae bacterium]
MCRLYLITPAEIPDLGAFTDQLRQAFQAGAGTAAEITVLQLRLKDADEKTILMAAKKLRPLCHEFGAALLINDRPDLAQQAGADGAHIGQSDMSMKQSRALLGEGASIGVTCHDSRHLALLAGEGGADYVAFGAFFPTTTKQTSHHPDPQILSWWHHATTVPSVAIGGITPENAGVLIEAKADFIAVCGAVWQHKDGPAAAICAFGATLAQQ